MTKIEFFNLIGSEKTKTLVSWLSKNTRKSKTALLLFKQLHEIDFDSEITHLFFSLLPEKIRKEVYPCKVLYIYKVKVDGNYISDFLSIPSVIVSKDKEYLIVESEKKIKGSESCQLISHKLFFP